MATLVGEIRDEEEPALSFNPGGSHIQIESISIDISSGEINEGMEECNHFSIRGFVRNQRKKDSRLCSPFIPDGDGDKSNNIASSLELPPLDVHKFKWWRCSGCLQDCNSSQGEGSNSKGKFEKSLPKRRRNGFLQQEPSSLSNLLSKEDNQRSAANENQSVEEERNLKGKRLLIQNEDVFSAGLDCFGTRPSAELNKLDSSFGGTISKPPVMGPPKTSSKKNSSTRPEAHGSAKTTCAAQTTTPPPVATIRNKTNYAKRSVQQPDRAVGDFHKGVTHYSQTLQHDGVAKGGDPLMPERFNDGHVPPQSSRNQVLGSSSTSTKKDSNYSTAGRAPERGHQFVQDTAEGDLYQRKDGSGTDKKINSVSPLVESNRLFKKPRNDLDVEATGRNNMYVHLRRGPKIRLLSDVIAKYPTNVGEQPDNNSKACASKFSDQSTKRKASPSPSPVVSHETPSGSDKAAAEQSTKSKNPRYDSPPKRGVSVSSGSWNKRKRSTVQHSVHFAETDRTVSPPRRYIRPGMDSSAELDFSADANKAFNESDAEKRSKPWVQNASPPSVPSQPRQASSRDNCEMPLSSNSFSLGQAAAASTPLHGCHVTDGIIDKSNKNIFNPVKDKRTHGFGKHISIPQIGNDHQPATKILQFGPENAPEEGTSGSIIGSGSQRRSHVERRGEDFSAPSSTMKDYLKTSVSTGYELWNSRVRAGGLLVECKDGEGASCTQQKGIKGRVKDIDINSIPVDEKTPEPGVADDIPMDIVELLAKLQQQERHCARDREKLSVQADVNVVEKSSAQKLNSSCLLKPQASYSYSYANNGTGRVFEPISMSSGEKKISSDGSRFDQSWKNVLVGCPNDDQLAPGPWCSAYNTQSQVQVPGAAVESWKGSMGPFSPVSQLQPAVHSMFNRPPPAAAAPPPLNTQTWVPRSMSSSYSNRVAPDMGQMGMYMRHSQLNIGNPNPSSSTTQSWTCTEYAAAAAAAAAAENGGGRQNISHQFVFPMAAAPPRPSKETIPAMQLLNFVRAKHNPSAEFLRKSKLPFDNHRQYSSSKPPYAPGPHFEPYNKLNTARAGGSSDQVFGSAAPALTSHTPSMMLTHPRFSSANKTKKPKQKQKQKQKLAPTAKDAARPSQSQQICVTNRNPAEMSLDFKQVRTFMISPEDLRRRPEPTIAPNPHTVY